MSESTVKRLFGSLRSDMPMQSPEQENEVFEEAMASRDAELMGKQPDYSCECILHLMPTCRR